MTFRNWLHKHLPPAAFNYLRKLAYAVVAWWFQNDLNRLAGIFHTDKWGSHWYTQHYERYFRALRLKRITLLEIGVGGYSRLDVGGESLRMWKAYFRKGQIVGIDLYDKTHLSERRLEVRQCDQTDKNSLLRLSEEFGGFDIIIDDGSHINEHVVETFKLLFPLLRPNGIYAIEDTQTAYWPTWGGGIDNPKSSVSFLKCLVDGLNYAEYPTVGYQPSTFDKGVVEVAFFHNLVFIRKGDNDERTNVPDILQREIVSLRSSQ